MSFGNNDSVMKQLHQQMKTFLNEEEAALEQRIKWAINGVLIGSVQCSFESLFSVIILFTPTGGVSVLADDYSVKHCSPVYKACVNYHTVTPVDEHNVCQLLLSFDIGHIVNRVSPVVVLWANSYMCLCNNIKWVVIDPEVSQN